MVADIRLALVGSKSIETRYNKIRLDYCSADLRVVRDDDVQCDDRSTNTKRVCDELGGTMAQEEGSDICILRVTE